MLNPNDDHSVRSCAKALIGVIDQYDSDRDSGKLRSGLSRATRALVNRADLLTLGTKRQANHIDNSRVPLLRRPAVAYLDEFPKDKLIPPHDHGIWEALVVCSGRLSHSVYARTDDGKVEGACRIAHDGGRHTCPGTDHDGRPAQRHSQLQSIGAQHLRHHHCRRRVQRHASLLQNGRQYLHGPHAARSARKRSPDLSGERMPHRRLFCLGRR